jgi:osmoprotectant transport system permease protein
LYREELPPQAVEAIQVLHNAISEEEIRSMNEQVLFGNIPYTEVASQFIKKKGWAKRNLSHTGNNEGVLNKIGEHIWLTSIALLVSVLIAVPLGVVTYWKANWSPIVLYAAGLLQTIPSIALLAILIPVTGIGVLPAMVALFLYALLPILRSTVTGLATIDPSVKILADGLGMSPWQKLRFVEFPLAVPSILSGIRTAAVINIGTATLAAFIGAGGLGEFVVTGLALNNYDLILRGAIPAAILAILTELLFEMIDRFLLPAHLRNRSKNLTV